MSKYTVELFTSAQVEVEVDAESEREAKDRAFEALPDTAYEIDWVVQAVWKECDE